MSKFSSINPSKNYIILVYANWCGFCQMLKPQWATFKRECGNMPGLNFLEIEDNQRAEAEKNAFIKEVIQDVHGYPTIRFYNSATKTVSQFTDERTSEALNAFLKKKMPAVKKSEPKKTSPKKISGGAVKPKSKSKVVSKPKTVSKSKVAPKKKVSLKKGGFVRDGVYFGDKSYSS